MIDASHFTSREDLLAAMPRDLVWAEIGVNSGSFSKLILSVALPRKLFLVDCWEILPWTDPGDVISAYNGVIALFKLDQRVAIVKDWSLSFAEKCHKESFDVVYIDADHNQGYADVSAWWPKVRHGGYIWGDDYTSDCVSVQADLDRFAEERGLRLTATKERQAQWLICKE